MYSYHTDPLHMPRELKMELHNCKYRYVEGPGEAESPQWRIIIKLCMLRKSTFHDSTVQLLAKNLEPCPQT